MQQFDLMKMRNISFVLFALLIAGVVVCNSQVSRSEKEKTLDLCKLYFGPPLDEKLNLFGANSFYVLHVTFDRKGDVEKLEVVPRFYFEEDHPEWKESDDFEYLSLPQYQSLVVRVDLIKSKGELTKPASPISVVTNSTAWHTEVYSHALFTWGELVDLRRSEDGPAEVKWFRVEFGKKLDEKKLPSVSTKPPSFSTATSAASKPVRNKS